MALVRQRHYSRHLRDPSPHPYSLAPDMAPRELRPPVVRLVVKVTPRASRNEAIGWDELGRLRVRVRAAPADGEANAELLAWLAKTLGLRKTAVRIVSGGTSRQKTIEIEGLTQEELKGVFS